MTTADLIAELLGPNWWDKEHDQTVLCALLDRVMEEANCDRDAAYGLIRDTTNLQTRLGLTSWIMELAFAENLDSALNPEAWT